MTLRSPALPALCSLVLGLASAARPPAAAEQARLEALLRNDGIGQFLTVPHDRFHLHFYVTILPAGAAKPGDKLLFEFRELFTGKRSRCLLPQGRPDKLGRQMIAASEADVTLAPGAYHVRVDLVRGGKPLSRLHPGSAWFYARRPGESHWLAKASFFLARAATALWNPKHQVYMTGMKPTLPTTADPLDAEHFTRWITHAIDRNDVHMELMNDGGQGYLAGARIYRTLGMPERAAFCNTVLKRMLIRLDDARFGKLHNLVGKGDGYRSRGYSRAEAVYLLKFACQVAAHFHTLGTDADKAYARDVLRKVEPLLDAELRQKLGTRVRGRCTVYDGRFLADFAEYDRAALRMGLPYPTKYTAQVLPHMLAVARLGIESNGWYDKGCLTEGSCHVWYGELYALEALQPFAECLRTLKGKPEHAKLVAALPTLEKSIKAMMFFLTNTNGSMTGIWHYGPTDNGECPNGSLDLICADHLRLFGPNKSVARYRRQLPLENGYHNLRYIHSQCACATFLTHCPEYLRTAEGKRTR